MRADRLLLVAKALRESQCPQAFIMTRIHTCGTPHCAFGHYIARRDLQQIFQFPMGDFAEQIGEHTGAHMHNVIMSGVWGATSVNFNWRRCISEHFDLDDTQVQMIFGPHGCNDADTAEAAADYIETYVRRFQAGLISDRAWV